MIQEDTDYMYYARALAIIVVVYTHVGFSSLGNIMLFAMPLFFFQAGWFYKPAGRSLRQEAAASFKKLMVPFYAFMAFYAVLGMIREVFFGYAGPDSIWCSVVNTVWGSSLVPNFGGRYAEILEAGKPYNTSPLRNSVDVISPINCHLWFLPAMFTGRLIFCAFVQKVKTPASRLALLAALVGAASAEGVLCTQYQLFQLPLGLGRGFIAAAWMLAGFWLREKGLFSKWGAGTKSSALVIAASAAAAVTAGALGSNGAVMIRSYYGPHGVLSVYLTYIGGLGALILVIYLCRFLEKAGCAGIKRGLLIVGEHTIAVYLWHMTAKTVLDILYCLALGHTVALDEFMMGMMPDESWPFMLFEGFACVAVCTLWGVFRTRKAKRAAAHLAG